MDEFRNLDWSINKPTTITTTKKAHAHNCYSIISVFSFHFGHLRGQYLAKSSLTHQLSVYTVLIDIVALRCARRREKRRCKYLMRMMSWLRLEHRMRCIAIEREPRYPMEGCGGSHFYFHSWFGFGCWSFGRWHGWCVYMYERTHTRMTIIIYIRIIRCCIWVKVEEW